MARRRSYNRRHRRGYRRRSRNGGLASMARGTTAAFNTSLLKKSFFLVGGSLANNQLTNFLGKLTRSAFFTSGPGSYVLGLLGAGLVGIGARKVVPGYAAPIFFGAVLDPVSRAVNKYIMPRLPSPGAMKGLADYLTVQGAYSAVPMGSPAYGSLVNQANISRFTSSHMAGIDDFGEMAVADELDGL